MYLKRVFKSKLKGQLTQITNSSPSPSKPSCCYSPLLSEDMGLNGTSHVMPMTVMPCHGPFRVHLENGPQEDWQAFPLKSSHFGRPLLKPRLSNQVMDIIQGLHCTWLLSWLPVQTVDILLLNVAASSSFRKQLLGLRVCRWLGHVGYIFLTILLSLLVRLAGSPETTEIFFGSLLFADSTLYSYL